MIALAVAYGLGVLSGGAVLTVVAGLATTGGPADHGAAAALPARGNGLDPPCGATGDPSVADRSENAHDAVPEPDGPIPAPGGPLPARRTPRGHAA